ncbi:hypothetical protein [Pararhodobacter sp.]|uniref:hypothetical protein n=1 Tax=Pararhodobacter sp. TaxID=2127056 RepID=UPI002AFFDFA0|nr:hypothetical protein [Pararhodobacter sp.]
MHTNPAPHHLRRARRVARLAHDMRELAAGSGGATESALTALGWQAKDIAALKPAALKLLPPAREVHHA